MWSVIKIEAHIIGTEPECQRNAPPDFRARAAAIESIKIVAHVDEVYSASAKNEPSWPGFCHLDVFET